MAELAASVITIAHTVCMLIENSQKAIKYIDEIKSINDPINDLLANIKGLERLTKTVESTCKGAESGISGDSRSLRDVRKTLADCHKRLENLKPLAFELAALESRTWRQRATIKMRLDRVKSNIKAMKGGIQWDMTMLNTQLHCLNVDLSGTRRTSDSTEGRSSIACLTGTQTSTELNISPISRTMSDAETIFGPDPDLELRRFSTSLSLSPRLSVSSRPSVSSTSSHTPSRLYHRSDSVTSAVEHTPLTSKNEWKDFDFYILKCGRKQERIQEIREILQRHSDGIALARSTDTSDRTPLHIAAQRGDVDLARVLIDEYQADIDAQDSKPCSVLDLAVAGRHRDFVALLLERGVDERAISTRHKPKFREMKRTIIFERQAASKSRSMSQSIQPAVTT
ncbi:hypothetical protein CC86DRAFT_409707 [Ophiobolus disseminans]|uniref:Uncharacterized protein n=1 Tax=Ophiobolus disseminans TaxID=1469910 RepID=A0A6A6ZR66_9PLEO|nr:hypothetical protein CC86DRAFT_409707 [Ophiobolus disseminans]